MTQRKPGGVDFQSWIDQQITQHKKEGGFENLAGHGKPIPNLENEYDPDWWVKNKIKEEGLDATPHILKVKAQVERWKKGMTKIYSAAMLKKQLKQLNQDITKANHGVLGPIPPIPLLSEETILNKWKLYNKD